MRRRRRLVSNSLKSFCKFLSLWNPFLLYYKQRGQMLILFLLMSFFFPHISHIFQSVSCEFLFFFQLIGIYFLKNLGSFLPFIQEFFLCSRLSQLLLQFQLLLLCLLLPPQKISVILLFIFPNFCDKSSSSLLQNLLVMQTDKALIHLFPLTQPRLLFQTPPFFIIIDRSNTSSITLLKVLHKNKMLILILLASLSKQPNQFVQLINNRFRISLQIMILSYNWQILQHAIQSEAEIKERVDNNMPLPEDSFISQEENNNASISPTILKCPNFGFLFSYSIESPQQNQPEIELVPEITIYQEPIKFKTERLISAKNFIYLQLEIQNSEIYDNLMVLTVKIRYHTEPKLPKIHNIEQLVRMAGNRQINLYTATTYTTIKKQLILESPVVAEWRNQKDAYLHLKLSKSEDNMDIVEILEVEVMNWLAPKEETRKLIVNNLVKKPFKLRQRQAYALLFSLSGSMTGLQIPYYITYRLSGSAKTFKIVKYISLFDYK